MSFSLTVLVIQKIQQKHQSCPANTSGWAHKVALWLVVPATQAWHPEFDSGEPTLKKRTSSLVLSSALHKHTSARVCPDSHTQSNTSVWLHFLLSLSKHSQPHEVQTSQSDAKSLFCCSPSFTCWGTHTAQQRQWRFLLPMLNSWTTKGRLHDFSEMKILSPAKKRTVLRLVGSPYVIVVTISQIRTHLPETVPVLYHTISCDSLPTLSSSAPLFNLEFLGLKPQGKSLLPYHSNTRNLLLRFRCLFLSSCRKSRT